MPQALYPGTFDPITHGHVDILQRAVAVFGTVEVAVAEEPPKSTLLSVHERVSLVRRVTKTIENVSVQSFKGLLVDHARRREITVLVRGLRQSDDFAHEHQMAAANRKMYPELETVCLFTAGEYNFISSTLVREIYHHGGDLSPFVPAVVCESLTRKRELGSIN